MFPRGETLIPRPPRLVEGRSSLWTLNIHQEVANCLDAEKELFCPEFPSGPSSRARKERIKHEILLFFHV